MSDFPRIGSYPFPVGVLSPVSEACPLLDYLIYANHSFASTTVGNKLAYYIPVLVPFKCRVFQLGCWNGPTVSGNQDVGIYTEQGKLLINSGTQLQAGASGLQLFDVADTDVGPGVVFLAFVQDNAVGTYFQVVPNAQVMRACSMRGQSLGALPLPATATFANPPQNVIPFVFAVYESAVF